MEALFAFGINTADLGMLVLLVETDSKFATAGLKGLLIAFWLLCLGLMLAKSALFNVAMAADAPIPQQAGERHLGVVTCAGSTCHGATETSKDSSVKQDEFMIWNRKDKHAKAYIVLFNEASKRMAANLGLASAQTAKICLDCHSDNVPEAARGKRFHLDDGIGCEACHGGGERYLGPHVSGKNSHQDNISMGLYPTENPEARARLCLSCHLGTKDKFATHKIMGAGHPRISFELDTFSQLQPVHYVVDKDYKTRKGVASGAQVWAVGQLLAVEHYLDLLLEPAYQTGGLFPELAFFDCHGCHRPMKKPQWAARDSSGLGPGSVHLNDANLLMLRAMLQVLAPELGGRLREAMLRLHQASTQGMKEVRQTAEQLRPLVGQAKQLVLAHSLSAQDLLSIILALVDEGQHGHYNDYGAAEQAAMALGALIENLKSDGGLSAARSGQLDNCLNDIDGILKNENSFEPERLIRDLQNISVTLKQ